MSDANSERRKLKRAVERIPAAFETASFRGTGYIKNVTKEGLFVRADQLPPPMEPVRVIFHNRDGNKIEVIGSVRWTTDQLQREDTKPGFGMRIETQSPDFLEFFEQILVR
ncbi:MAG: hypothetical protein GY725_25020 [bacterium]|nr:hypothetical protein [bacterium]